MSPRAQLPTPAVPRPSSPVPLATRATRVIRAASLALVGALLAGCAGGAGGRRAPAPASDGPAVWTVDSMRTRPGQQERYLRFLEANWTRARRTARRQGAIGAYQVLVLPADSGATLGWDVALLTEYPDSAAYARAEAVFRPILDAQGRTLVDGMDGSGANSPLRATYRSLVLAAGRGGALGGMLGGGR